MSTAKSEARIDIGGQLMAVEVRRYARARTYRLRLDAKAGILRLSMPERASIKRALAWAQDQRDWVAQQIARSPDLVLLDDGVVFPLEGRNVRICWDASLARSPRLGADVLSLGGPRETVGLRVLRWLKARAKLALSAESHDMANGAGLRVTSVAVGDPRSRWGSCSSTGGLRYSWRLILAPPEVRRATVAHEVAHLLHMDHSAAFHGAHADLLGEDPRAARQWLREHGAALHRISA